MSISATPRPASTAQPSCPALDRTVSSRCRRPSPSKDPETMKPQFWLIALFALLLVGTALADDKSDSLAIVMSKDSTLDNVSMPELIKIFRGEKSHAPDGTKFQLVMRAPGSDERSAILK